MQWRSQLSDTRRLEVSLYRTDIQDAVVFGSDGPQNVSSARINGFEAALKQELFGWQSSLGLAMIDPRDRDSGRTLARRARRTVSLDPDRQFDHPGARRQLAGGQQQLRRPEEPATVGRLWVARVARQLGGEP